MITIVCGEDIVRSREYLLQLEEQFKKKGFGIQKIPALDIQESLSSLSSAPNLFGQSQVFVTELLNRHIARKSSTNVLLNLLEAVSKNKSIELIIWETVSVRDLKLKNIGTVKEFKPSKNIFQLLDSCYPANFSVFHSLLNDVASPQNEMFVFVMLARHLRTLLSIKLKAVDLSKLPPWQAGKLKSQAAKWPEKALLSFYDGLYRIDASLKTGRNPQGVKNSLDVLACYIL